MPRTPASTLLLVGLLASSLACNLGRSVDKATLKTLAPGMLADDDVGMACAAGGSLAPVTIALGHRSGGAKEPKKAAALTLIAAGMCSERAAWESELERALAMYRVEHGDPKEGAALQDLLIRERRSRAEAAARNLKAYERVVAAYGAPTDEALCPRRLPERDQLLCLLGMTAGLLAVIHDTAADRAVGVSQAIPRHVQRGVGCVDDERWWGLPGSLKAAIGASIPGAGEPGVDPWTELERAARQGEAKGVWLGRALQVHTAAAAGKDEVVRMAIAAHGQAIRGGEGEPAVALLNTYASSMIQQRSDLLWIAAAGHRTPIGALGELPQTISDDEADALLEGLEDEAPPPAATSPAPAGEPSPTDAPASGGQGPAASTQKPQG